MYRDTVPWERHGNASPSTCAYVSLSVRCGVGRTVADRTGKTVSDNITPQPSSPRDARKQARADRAYKKASRPWVLRHWVLSAIGALIIVIIIAVAASSGGGSNGNSANNGGETGGKVLQHSEDVKITKCGKDSLGDLDAKVAVTNHSSKASDYLITVAFESKDGSRQITTGNAIVDSLQPGQTTVQDAGGLTAYSRPFKCVISDAQRTESSL